MAPAPTDRCVIKRPAVRPQPPPLDNASSDKLRNRHLSGDRSFIERSGSTLGRSIAHSIELCVATECDGRRPERGFSLIALCGAGLRLEILDSWISRRGKYPKGKGLTKDVFLRLPNECFHRYSVGRQECLLRFSESCHTIAQGFNPEPESPSRRASGRDACTQYV